MAQYTVAEQSFKNIETPMLLTFKQFLQSEPITEAKKKVKIHKPKPRPKKNLWFSDRQLWHADLEFAHPGEYSLHHSDEENEEQRSYYALDPTGKICHGMWQGNNKRGITFHKPRHIAVVKNPRVQLKQLDTQPSYQHNIISRPETY